MRLMIVVLILLLPAPAALAVLVTVGFEGTVEAVDNGLSYAGWPVDQYGLLPPISPGDHFSGSFSYDTSAPNVTGFPYGYNLDQLTSTRAEVEINGEVFVLQQPPAPFLAQISLGNNAILDAFQFLWVGRSEPYQPVEDEFEIYAMLVDSPEYDVRAIEQPWDIPGFSSMGFARFKYIARRQTIINGPPPRPIPPGWRSVEETISAFSGPITSMRFLSIVPEPRAALLLAPLAAVAVWRATRQRSGVRE